MRVAILGFGIEGQAAARYWAAKGAAITICDGNLSLEVPAVYASKLGTDYREALDSFDLIVRSQSVRYSGDQTKVTSGIREFFAQVSAPVIGITGTKGKGTTSTLIARILQAAGKTVHLAGNIGRSPLEILGEIKPTDIVVLELSSTQLLDLEYSPHIAVCLMIAPDHQDWHTDMDEYTRSKGNLFAHQKPSDIAIGKLGDETSERLAALSPGKQLRYGMRPAARVESDRIVVGDTDIMGVDEVALLGAHNLENICAAITATWDSIDHDIAVLKQAIMAFTGLEHRLECAGEVDGVKYYDDSFSTNPDTAIAAIKAFEADKVVILGGSSKKASFDELAQIVEDHHVIHALLIGEEAPIIAKSLTKVGFTHFTIVKCTNMQQLIDTAYQLTEPGDIVLLSPACASFDLFKNYKVRGDQFHAAVHNMKERLDGQK
ncbi:MAG: UDP-N-acetylmuramoyl-L-alanine--D-glutamate ligase [Candidatus Saccharibacteria bacterium]